MTLLTFAVQSADKAAGAAVETAAAGVAPEPVEMPGVAAEDCCFCGAAALLMVDGGEGNSAFSTPVEGGRVDIYV